MLRVAVIVLQILHPLLAWYMMPVSKPRYERAMQDDELRAPCGSLYGLHVLLKVRGGEAHSLLFLSRGIRFLAI